MRLLMGVMTTLSELLLADKTKRPRILAACERLVDDEVGSKGGLTGLAIKGAYKVVQSIKPGFVRDALDHLVDDFVKRLEPFFAHHIAGGAAPKGFADALSKQSGAVADALLGITDDRAKRAQNPTLKSAYAKLRPQARKHVEEAVPRLGKTLAEFL
jgi:hypothetical protein